MKIPAIPITATVGNITRIRCAAKSAVSGYFSVHVGETTLINSGANITPRTVTTPRATVAATVTV